MKKTGMTPLNIILILCLIMAMLLSGCRQNNTSVKTVTLEPLEEEKRIEEPVPEDQLDIILKKLQGEMRVFDVLEYHDDLLAEIKPKVSGGESDETLNEIIKPIVEMYVYDVLSEKIIEALGENYAQADYDWLYRHVETKSLQTLMVAYEREYIKHTEK